MDMTMTTTASAASATSSSSMASMATSTSASTSMAMSMSDMAMTFFTAVDTPLFSDAWTPASQGQYAATCIFLIALAVVLRAFIAFKPVMEARFWTESAAAAATSRSPRARDAGHAERNASVDSKDMLVHKERMAASGSSMRRHWASWRVGSAMGQATYELFIVGIGYLLMLAVMTMNVGYFLSVLAGAWLGTFMLGSPANNSQWEHC